MAKDIEIGGRLHSTATGNVVTGANEILDDELNKKQSQINSETLQHVESIDAALQELSPDQTEALALATDVVNLKKDVDQGAVFDVSAKYPTSGVDGGNTYTLEGALAVLNANLPANKKKGGMSIKFVQSSDNKYVQYRYMLEYANTTAGNQAFLDTANWQGVTNEVKAGSKDLAESGGVYDSVRDDIIGADVINKTVNVSGTSTTTTGITLKKDIKYVIHVQCLTAVDANATGIYVYDNSDYTKIKDLTAAEFADGYEFEYTPSSNCTLYVRPYATGTVAVKVWDMTNYLTLKQLEASIDNVEKEAELGSNIHIATYVPAFEEEDYVVTSTSADVKSTGVIPNQRIKVYIKSSELQRFAVYDMKNIYAGPIIEIPNGTDFSDGLTFEFTCPETMVADQYGHYLIAFRTWLATTLDNFNCYRLEPNPSTEDTVIKNKVRALENFKTNISSADVIAAIAGENLKFSNIQYDSDGKILSSGLNWPDGGGGTMTIHYDGDVIDYIDYTKVEGRLGNIGTYRQSIVYYSDGNVQGNTITKIA